MNEPPKKNQDEEDEKESKKVDGVTNIDKDGLNAKIIERAFIEMEKFNMIDTLKIVISSSTNIALEECDYSVNGYGPNMWRPSISESVPCRFKVITIGDDRIPYVIREPLCDVKISDIDTLTREIYCIVENQLNNTMIFLKEPANVRMLNAQYSEPEHIGFPYSSLLQTNYNVDLIHNALVRYLSPIRRRENFNFSDGYIFNGSHNVTAMQDFFDISQREMRVLSQTIETEELRTRREIPDTLKLPVFGNNSLYEVAISPFTLNEMFARLPRRMRFSSSMITELQGFNFGFDMIDTSLLQKSASISITRTASISAMFSISYTPDMSVACTAFMISLINPGLIEFDIDMSDIDPNDYPLRLMCGLSAKILFARSDNTRWNTVSRRGLREVEQAIMEALLSSRTFTLNDPHNPNILMRITPGPDAHLRNFAHLVTDGVGQGWREGPHERYAEHPATMPYRACCRRQLYVNEIEDTTDLDNDARILQFHGWATANAASALLSAMTRSGEDRSNYNGVAQVFKILSGRIFNFFAAINEYNRYNWYSSLRLRDEDLNNLYEDGTEEVVNVQIKGKTILYLMKALSEKVIHERRVPYLSQIKAECAIARDCVESSLKRYIQENVRRMIHIPENSYTRHESLQQIMPTDGPLHTHLNLIAKSGMSALCDDFYACVDDSAMAVLLREMGDNVMTNLLEYGILNAVHLSTRIANRTVEHLSEYTTRNMPYTNIGLFEEEDLPDVERHNLNLSHLGTWLTQFKVKQTLRDYSCNGVVTLNIPIPFTISTNTIVGDVSDDIIQVKYDPKRRDNNVRHCIQWKPVVLNITDIDRNKLLRPDLYVTNFSTIDRIGIPSDAGSRILMSVEAWLTQLDREAIRCVYIRTDNVKIVSPFARS
uniref:VP3 n=1 Tax=Hubei lepidoptera virus 4 TaxID=1922906 RepID=A0A1L3KP02_9VIRU|nr:hypothetical protein 2 [Hubei lepidoptera virus 4]